MNLRFAQAKCLDWIDARRESGFSNFLFIDQNYAAHPVMRRMAELRAPELFTATRHKFGELLISADRPPAADLSLLLAARFPAHALLRANGNLTVQPTGVTGHTGLFAPC